MNLLRPLSRGQLITSALALLGILTVVGAYAVWQQPAAAPRQLLLHCGAGLRPAAAALIAAFEASHPDLRVKANYAGSDKILSQVSLSRRGDLFMPGEALYAELAREQGLTADATQRIAAYFIPVILVGKGNPLGIRSLQDLVDMKLRLGLGDPRACAVGKQARQIFAKTKISAEQLRANLIFQSATVNELAVAVAMQNLDAGVVWDATARQFSNAADLVAIPPQHNIVTEVPIVRLAFSRHPEAAEAFIEFITSDAGKQILRSHHYAVHHPDGNPQLNEVTK